MRRVTLLVLGVAQFSLCVLAFRRGWEVGLVLVLLNAQLGIACHYLGVALAQQARLVELLGGFSSLLSDHLRMHVEAGEAMRQASESEAPKVQGRVH